MLKRILLAEFRKSRAYQRVCVCLCVLMCVCLLKCVSPRAKELLVFMWSCDLKKDTFLVDFTHIHKCSETQCYNYEYKV